MLGTHPDLAGVVVTARRISRGEAHLAAYVVSYAPGPTVAELRAFLGAKLPEVYGRGSVCAVAGVAAQRQRKGGSPCVARAGSESADRKGICGARTATERQLAEIWQEVLGLSRIGIHDNFFDLGGHSPLAVQIASRVRLAFKRDLPVRLIFDSGTVAKLAAVLERLMVSAVCSGNRPAFSPTTCLDTSAQSHSVPASFNQAQIWFLQQLNPRSSVYNLACRFRLSGNPTFGVAGQSRGVGPPPCGFAHPIRNLR